MKEEMVGCYVVPSDFGVYGFVVRGDPAKGEDYLSRFNKSKDGDSKEYNEFVNKIKEKFNLKKIEELSQEANFANNLNFVADTQEEYVEFLNYIKEIFVNDYNLKCEDIMLKKNHEEWAKIITVKSI